MDAGSFRADAVAKALDDKFEYIRIGVQDDASIVLGYDWNRHVEDVDQRRVAQCFTSTMAGGGYGGKEAFGTCFEAVCRQLLRAAYLAFTTSKSWRPRSGK